MKGRERREKTEGTGERKQGWRRRVQGKGERKRGVKRRVMIEEDNGRRGARKGTIERGGDQSVRDMEQYRKELTKEMKQ